MFSPKIRMPGSKFLRLIVDLVTLLISSAGLQTKGTQTEDAIISVRLASAFWSEV
jgi:hypothetical protein